MDGGRRGEGSVEGKETEGKEKKWAIASLNSSPFRVCMGTHTRLCAWVFVCVCVCRMYERIDNIYDMLGWFWPCWDGFGHYLVAGCALPCRDVR